MAPVSARLLRSPPQERGRLRALRGQWVGGGHSLLTDQGSPTNSPVGYLQMQVEVGDQDVRCVLASVVHWRLVQVMEG